MSERAKALELALAQIERQFGKGSIMKMVRQVPPEWAVIPTGRFL